MNNFNNTALINEMLFKNYTMLNGKWEANSKWGFLVYSELMASFCHFLEYQGVKYLPDVWDYQLKLNDKVYNMKLIFLTWKSDEIVNFIQYLIAVSQFTFLWYERSTLFRAHHQYHELQEFISINKLKSYITKEETFVGVNSEDQPINVITFNKKINRHDLIEKFMSFLQSKHSNKSNSIRVYHYYFTFAFPWQQPSRLSHFNEPLANERTIFGLQTFLACMRELSYKQEPYLDFIGLCSLKLAFCDDREPLFATNDLEYEICSLIQRSLKKMAIEQTYIRNNEFNLCQYAADDNCAPFLQDIPIYYFQYRFQEYFKSVRISNIVTRLNIYSSFKAPQLESLSICYSPSVHVRQTIKLVDETNILRKLNDMSNASLIIDGENYSKMNHKLFCDIVNFRNIEGVVLDTNYEWSDLNPVMYRGDANQSKIYILLIGGNQYNFIEKFLPSIFQISNSHNFILLIQPKLKDYRVFKDLNVSEIVIDGISITKELLKELHDCNFKQTQLQLLSCNIEGDIETWELLNELNLIQVIIIQEENTWQYLFEFVVDYLTKFELKEFQFKIDLRILFDTNKMTDVKNLKFTFDEFKTRLEIRDGNSGEMVDLYYIKNPQIELEENGNFYGLNK